MEKENNKKKIAKKAIRKKSENGIMIMGQRVPESFIQNAVKSQLELLEESPPNPIIMTNNAIKTINPMESQSDLNAMSEDEKKTTILSQSNEIITLKAELFKEKNKANTIAIIAKHLSPISQLVSNYMEKKIQKNASEAKFSIWMAIIAVFVVFSIIVIAGTLTYLDKIDGATFTFLLGLIVGYVLTFIREAISPFQST